MSFMRNSKLDFVCVDSTTAILIVTNTCRMCPDFKSRYCVNGSAHWESFPLVCS